MKIWIWDIKKEAIELLEGKWKSAVLGLFVPFVIGLLLTFSTHNALLSEKGLFLNSFFESVVFSFFASVVSYAFLIGVSNLILSRSTSEQKNGFFRVLFISFASFSRALLPAFMLKFVYQTVNKLLFFDNVMVFYDMLFYSYIELPEYITIIQIIRAIVNILFFYFNIVYIFTPCVLAESPFIKPKFAMQMSERLIAGKKWRMIFLLISFISVIALGFLAAFVGAFFAFSYQLAAICVFYRKQMGDNKDSRINKIHVMLRKMP